MMAFENEWHRIQLNYPVLPLIIFTDPGVDDALMLLQILCTRKYPIAGADFLYCRFEYICH